MEGSRERYKNFSVTATTTEQAVTFPQATKFIKIKNTGGQAVTIVFLTDQELEHVTTTVDKYLSLIAGTTAFIDTFEDDLAVKTVRFKSASSTSAMQIYGSW